MSIDIGTESKLFKRFHHEAIKNHVANMKSTGIEPGDVYNYSDKKVKYITIVYFRVEYYCCLHS